MTSARTVLLALAAVIVAVGAGFAAWQTLAETRHPLVFAAGTEGGTYARFASTFADTLEADETIDIRVIPTAGAEENAQMIGNGTADLGLVQSDTTVWPGTRVVARLFPEAFHLVARNEAGIETVNDLAGARVGLPPEGAGSNRLFASLIAHHEIDVADVRTVHAPLSELEEAITTGEIDAFFMVIALGNDTIARIIQTTPTRLVPISQAEAIAMFDPALEAEVVPVGTYSGQRPVPAEPTPVVSAHSLLVAREDVPDAVVETVTRHLFESRQRMVETLPQAAFVNAPTESERLSFGVHPGAELYYSQDEPPFVVKYAEAIALGLSALALLASAVWQGRIWLANARKDRADRYNRRIVDLVARIEAARDAGEFEAIRAELFDIFRRVIIGLDDGRIDEQSLVSFSFAWQVAAATLNHRQLAVGDASAPPASAQRFARNP